MVRAEELALNTVKLDIKYKDGTKKVATSFFYSFNLSKGTTTCLVTNRHVIQDAININTNVRISMDDDGKYPDYRKLIDWKIDDFTKGLIFHPDKNVDLAIMLVGPVLQGLSYCIRSIGRQTRPTPEELQQITILQDVVMVGYPNGLIDDDFIMPVCRRGMIATPPLLDFKRNRVFLIDIACTDGSSGSPVFVYDYLWQKCDNGQLTKIDQARFMGIFAGGYEVPVIGVTMPSKKNEERQRTTTPIPCGIGAVVKASCLDDFIPILERICQESSQ